MKLNLTKGCIEGRSEDGLYVFKGIPYAKADRFQAPTPIKPWDGVLCCQKYGKPAVQNGCDYSEDCLSLNVWTEDVETLKPVVVWIHGGGFTSGSNAGELQSGIHFADGIVFVSVNYRLGVFGFLSLNQTSGNHGLLDLIEALKWVKENIQHFGGDASKITIMGESAGAKCVAALMMSPLAKGLFHQAILQSGSYQAIRDLTTADYITEKFLSFFNNPKDIFSASPETLLQAQNQLVTTGMGMIHLFGPVIDGKVILSSPQEAIQKGEASLVPLLIGTNLEESETFLSGNDDLRLQNEMTLIEMFGNNASHILNAVSPTYSWSDVLTDYQYKIHSYRLATTYAKRNIPVYFYRFDWKGKNGAGHAQELPFVFNVQGSEGLFDIPSSALPLAQLMNQYWKNFIKTGNPNNETLPSWKIHTQTDPNLMVFNQEITSEPLQNNWDDETYPDQVLILPS